MLTYSVGYSFIPTETVPGNACKFILQIPPEETNTFICKIIGAKGAELLQVLSPGRDIIDGTCYLDQLGQSWQAVIYKENSPGSAILLDFNTCKPGLKRQIGGCIVLISCLHRKVDSGSTTHARHFYTAQFVAGSRYFLSGISWMEVPYIIAEPAALIPGDHPSEYYCVLRTGAVCNSSLRTEALQIPGNSSRVAISISCKNGDVDRSSTYIIVHIYLNKKLLSKDIERAPGDWKEIELLKNLEKCDGSIRIQICINSTGNSGSSVLLRRFSIRFLP